MGERDDERFQAFKRSIDSSREKALKELAKFGQFKAVFDSSKRLQDEKQPFATQLTSELLEAIHGKNEIAKGMMPSGESATIRLGGHTVEIAVCAGNLAAGLFKGEKLIASVIITPKKKTTSAKSKVFDSAAESGIYYALIDKFSPWSRLPFEEMPGRKIAFDGVKKKIYANAMFKSFSSELAIADNIRYISETLDVKPAVVCTYLLRTGLITTGVKKLYNKLVAEGNQIAQAWKKHAGLEFEDRIRAVAADAGISPITACVQLHESDIPQEDRGKTALARDKFLAEQNDVLAAWNRHADLGLEARVKAIAEEMELSPFYLLSLIYVSGIQEEDRKKLISLRNKLLAEQAHIIEFHKKYQSLEPEEQVMAISKETWLSPIYVAHLLHRSELPKGERSKYLKLSRKLSAEKINLLGIWRKYSGKFRTAKERLLAAANEAGIAPVTACAYLDSSDITEKEKEGLSGLRSMFQKEKKQQGQG